MELKEFLKKFLPDYDKKIEEARDSVACTWSLFYETHFPEALQNFADKICERQREKCAREWQFAGKDEITCFDRILNANQPKIEEL